MSAPPRRRREPSPLARDGIRPVRKNPAESKDLLAEADASLLELVDHVLNRGVVVTGDVILGIAEVDLIYVRLSALLCAADRVLGPSKDGTSPAPPERGPHPRER
jgi:hypothetical protein